MNNIEEKNTFIQEQKPNIPKSNITIKLTGDADDLSEIVSDINPKYQMETKYNDQDSLQTNITSKFEPSKKRLKIKEELLPQRVVLVVPKNSPTHYPSSSKNNLTCNKNQSENVISKFQVENLKVRNEQQNNKSLAQNTVEDKSENTNSVYAKISDPNETHKEDMENYNEEHKRFNHNHTAKSTQSKQMINSQHSSKQLNKKKSQSLEPDVDMHKLQIIKKPFEFKNSLIDPIKRKLTVAENISRSFTLTQKFKNNVQSILDNNSAKDKVLLNNSTPMKILHLPIVISKNHPINHFKLNKLANGKRKVILNTISTHDETVENKTSPSRSPSNLTGTMNCLTGSQLVNGATVNQSFENKTTNSLFHPQDFDVSLKTLEINETFAQSSSQKNTSITVNDQKQSLKNAEIDVRLYKNSLNSDTSESITESNPQNQQKIIPLGTTSNKTIQIVFDNKEKNASQESNNYKCTNNTPKKRKFVASLGVNKLHNGSNEKQHIRSPQIKINGLTIRRPDPHLLNNLSLQEKIQKFRLSNKSCEKISSLLNKNTQYKCAEQHNNSGTLPEVSESLVSTTTVESGQPDKQIRECQCDQLRREVNEQWRVITRLRSRINHSLKDKKCDSHAEEESQLEDERHISSMLIKELEETNIKISENLRKEQLRNKTLKLTLKYKNTRIKQLELKLRTISKIFEETEKSALYLREILQSADEATNFVTAQSGIFN